MKETTTGTEFKKIRNSQIIKHSKGYFEKVFQLSQCINNKADIHYLKIDSDVRNLHLRYIILLSTTINKKDVKKPTSSKKKDSQVTNISV